MSARALHPLSLQAALPISDELGQPIARRQQFAFELPDKKVDRLLVEPMDPSATRPPHFIRRRAKRTVVQINRDRKSTRLNSSHLGISYAVSCLKTKNSTTR